MKKYTALLLLFLSAFAAHAQTAEDVKYSIDTAISTKNSPSSIRPQGLGAEMKRIVNFVVSFASDAASIVQDATHRFVTDIEKAYWNGKPDTAYVRNPANLIQDNGHRFATADQITYWNSYGDSVAAALTKAYAYAANPANIQQTSGYRLLNDTQIAYWNSFRDSVNAALQKSYDSTNRAMIAAASANLKGVADTATVPSGASGSSYWLKAYPVSVTYTRFNSITVGTNQSVMAVNNNGTWQAYYLPVDSALAQTNRSISALTTNSLNLSDNTAFVNRNLLANGTYDPSVSNSWLTSARIRINPGDTITMAGWKSLSTGSVRYVVRNSSGTALTTVNGTGNASAVTFIAVAGAYDLTVTIASGTNEGLSPSTSPYTKTFMVNRGAVARFFQTLGTFVNPDKILYKSPFVYASPTLGNDTTGTGERTNPFRTATVANNFVDPNGQIILMDGMHTMSGAVLQNQPRGGIIGERGADVRVNLGGTFLSSAFTKTPGYTNVYELTYAGSYNNTYWLWQHDTSDTKTMTPDTARVPVDNGKPYRNRSTRLLPAASIVDVDTSANNGVYKWIITGGKLYQATPSHDYTANPIVMPNVSASVTSNVAKPLYFNNVHFIYGSAQFQNTTPTIVDCSFGMSNLGGALQLDNTVGFTLVNPETYGCVNDGINGHVTITPAYKFAKANTGIIINPYSHDNGDDAISLHEYSNIFVLGGFLIYNGNGLTPASGGHMSVIGTYIGHTPGTGLSDQGSAIDGGVCTNLYAEGVVCEDNGTNFRASGNWTTFSNCTSRYPRSSHTYSASGRRINFTRVPMPEHSNNTEATTLGGLQKWELYRLPGTGSVQIVY